MAAPSARDSVQRREAGTARVGQTTRYALFPGGNRPATLFVPEPVAHVSGLSPLGLDRASAREKIKRQNNERYDEQ